MNEPTIGAGDPIDPATAPALCVACYLGEHDRCGPPCDCTHDGPPAPRDGQYVQDEDGVWWPRDDVGPRVEWDETGPADRRSAACGDTTDRPPAGWRHDATGPRRVEAEVRS